MIRLGKPKQTGLVGLEIEVGSIAAAEVHANGSTQLGKTAIAPLPAGVVQDGEILDPGAVTAALKDMFAEHGLSCRVRLGIANQRVVVRALRLPAIDDPKQLEEAVRFQAEEKIPMPLEQAVLDHRVVGGVPAFEGGAPQIDVLVIAARRDMIEAALKPVQDAGLEAVGADLSAFGLIRALGEAGTSPPDEHDEQPEAPASAVLYCNVGDITNLAIAKRRSCLFTRVSPTGLADIASSLAASTGLSDEHARMWLTHVGLAAPLETIEGDPGVIAAARTALEAGASAVIDELRLSLDFYGAQEAAVPVQRIVLSGPGGAVPGLAEWMEPTLGLPLSVGKPEALAGVDPVTAARLTVPYGLALDN